MIINTIASPIALPPSNRPPYRRHSGSRSRWANRDNFWDMDSFVPGREVADISFDSPLSRWLQSGPSLCMLFFVSQILIVLESLPSPRKRSPVTHSLQTHFLGFELHCLQDSVSHAAPQAG